MLSTPGTIDPGDAAGLDRPAQIAEQLVDGRFIVQAHWLYALGQQVMRHAGTWPLGFVGGACEVAALAVLFIAMRRRRRQPRSPGIDLAVPAPRPVR